MQIDVGGERRVFAGVADANHKFAGIDDPFLRGLIPIAEGARIETKSDVFGLAGIETNFLEAFQLALRTIGLRGRIGDVELSHFSAGDAAGIGDVEADGDRGAGGAVAGR